MILLTNQGDTPMFNKLISIIARTTGKVTKVTVDSFMDGYRINTCRACGDIPAWVKTEPMKSHDPIRSAVHGEGA